MWKREEVQEMLRGGIEADCAVVKKVNEAKAATAKAVKIGGGEAAAREAANIIANGGIVAFPTETVYGLGADAFNPTAVAGVYAAKGRPGDNPLILHVAGRDAFFELVESPPAYAHALIKAFWPGPLTLVAKKKPGLPSWVGGHPKGTAGTIGVRMPSHPLALAVIQQSGCVVAAPSANLAGTPSPTLAQHVAADFKHGDIDFILDGGAVPGGLESTVVDVTGPEPVVLRPGAITVEMVAEATGLKTHGPDMTAHIKSETPSPSIQPSASAAPAPDKNSNAKKAGPADPPRSPGMKYRHYAPKAPMTLLIGSESGIAAYVLDQCKAQNLHIGVLVTEETEDVLRRKLCAASIDYQHLEFITLGRKAAPETIAHNLYASLRQFDAIGVDVIYAEGLTQDGLGLAIMDRMRKAAEGRVVHTTPA